MLARMIAESRITVQRDNLIVEKLSTKWFTMRRGCQDYIDNQHQHQTGAAYADPHPYCDKMHECFTEIRRNTGRTIRGPIKTFGYARVTHPFERGEDGDGEPLPDGDQPEPHTPVHARGP